MDSPAPVPFLGSGFGYRREISAEIFQHADQIDFVEVIADQYMYGVSSLRFLQRLRETFIVIPHGVGLSIASPGPLEESYADLACNVSDACDSPYYSDHLCMTKVPGIDLGHLAPMWFTAELLKNTIEKVDRLQSRLGKQVVLENVTYDFTIPGADLSQEEFFGELVGATGCGMLLDVTNLYTNSVNHGFDPLEALGRLPLESIVQVHLAGGFWDGGVLFDGHCAPVPEEVWALFEQLVERTPVRAALLEHDAHFPAIEELLSQVSRARELLHR